MNIQAQNKGPLKPLSPEELQTRPVRKFDPNLPVEERTRELEQALDQAHAEAGEPDVASPVVRETFGVDRATREVRWDNNLFGSVTIGSETYGFGEAVELDKYTMVVPIHLRSGQPDSVTFSVKRSVVDGVKLFRSQMSQPADCTEGEMAPLTFPIEWVQGSRGKMPSTVKGSRDMDLVYLDTNGVTDGRKGAFVLLEVSISARRGQLWLGFQRLYAGQVVTTTVEKANRVGLQTVTNGNHQVGAVVPLTPEDAYPGSSFFKNFGHLANGFVTAALSYGASVPLSRCVVARWCPNIEEIPADLLSDDWTGATVAWFNATIGFGFLISDYGEPVMAHFKAIQDASSNAVWQQRVYPMLTPMQRVAVRLVHEAGQPHPKAVAIRSF